MNGYKNLEIRAWKTDKLGWIALHASKKIDRDGYQYIKEKIRVKNLPEIECFETGKILGIARIDGMIPFTNKPDFYLYRHKHLNNYEWWTEKCYGWVLINVKPIDPVECKGSLSLFDVSVLNIEVET
jgi:hypothetical protein